MEVIGYIISEAWRQCVQAFIGNVNRLLLFNSFTHVNGFTTLCILLLHKQNIDVAAVNPAFIDLLNKIGTTVKESTLFNKDIKFFLIFIVQV